MVKVKTSILIFIFFVKFSNAQIDHKTSKSGKNGKEVACFYVVASPSIPLGSYRSKDIYNNSSGLVKTGIVVDASFDCNLFGNFGLYATLYGQGNGVNKEQMADLLAPTQSSGSGYFDKNILATPWEMGAVFIGTISFY